MEVAVKKKKKTTERVAFEQMTSDIGVAKLRWEYASLVRTKFCLQQRKTSLLLAYIEILQHFSYKSSFCTSNLWSVICFALSTALPHSSLLTRAYASIVFFQCYWSQWLPWTVHLEHSSKYLLFCSTEKINSYSFGTTWGWVNDK